jgi:predicted secreted protein
LSIVGGIVAYLIIWWAVLFAVLPLGVRRQEDPILGTDPGAPEKPMLWRKAAITTGVSAVIWLGVYWLMETNYITFRPY